MTNKETLTVSTDDKNHIGERYEVAKSRLNSVNRGYDVSGRALNAKQMQKEHAKNLAEANIRMDIVGMEYHIQQIQKSIGNLKKETSNLDKLKDKSSSADWKTLNKDAYELLIDAEKKYFEETSQLLDKLNSHVNFHFKKMIEADQKLSKYLS
jgi:hypothetical protein